MFYFPDYYNNGGTNGGAGASGGPADGLPGNMAPGSAQGSYYQSDRAYAAPPAAKAPKKKLLMHKGGKPSFPGQGTNLGSAGGYQSNTPPAHVPYNQYGQGYGQGKKNFNQNHAGTGGYAYSTAYPSQVTGGAGGNQDYGYEGERTIAISSQSVW